MKSKILPALLFVTAILHAQDAIKMTNGADLNVKIIAVNPETVSYSVSEDKMDYFMVKNDIAEIRYANGTVEKIAHPEMTLEQIKSNILRYFSDDAVTDKDGAILTAAFEDNFLRIKENKKSAEGVLLDFKKAIRFDQISYRKDKGLDGLVNVWTMMQTSKKSNSWEKYKMVVRVHNHETAELLLSAFRQLSKALKSN
jgi:hypothetical protein